MLSGGSRISLRGASTSYGGFDSQGGYISKMYVETKESGPLDPSMMLIKKIMEITYSCEYKEPANSFTPPRVPVPMVHYSLVFYSCEDYYTLKV